MFCSDLIQVQMWQECGSKAVYNYMNDNVVITQGRLNVTSDNTPSGFLIS